MNELIGFVASRMVSRAFWLMVLATFFGLLMMSMRSGLRDEIFQAAASQRRKGF